MNQNLLEWLEKYRLVDAERGQCYEACPAPHRALMKTAIAFQFHYWKNIPAEQCFHCTDRHSGFSHTLTQTSAPWAILHIQAGFRSPARLLAALCPAILAGTEDLFIFFEGEADINLVTALELAGIEQIFILPPNAQKNMPIPCAADGNGRIILLKEDGIKSNDYCLSTAPTLSLWEDSCSPRVFYEASREDAVRLAHPDAVLTSAEEADVIFSDNAPTAQNTLQLNRGLECCWISLPPSHFINNTLSASFCTPSSPIE